jgi:hypothetical protein
MPDGDPDPEPGSNEDSFEPLDIDQLDELPGLYLEGSCLHIDLGESKKGGELNAALSSIPSSIRGEFHPWAVIFDVGRHELWGCIDSLEDRTIAWPAAAVKLWGYGVASDWAAYATAVRELPAVHAAQSELANLLGPTQLEVVWHP